jgi:hypothetical protein
MRLSGLSLAVGLLAASLCAGTALAQPANDTCGSPATLPLGTITVLNNALATDDSIAVGCSDIGRDVWYVFTAPAAGVVALDTCSTSPSEGLDTVMEVYATSPCGGLGIRAACNDDSCGLLSNLSFEVDAGATYWVRVGSYGSTPGGNIRLGAYFSPATVGQWTYQGRLLSGGTPVEGPVALRFSVFASETGGAPLFAHTTGTLTASNGLVKTEVPGPNGFNYANKWVQVEIIDPTTLATIEVLSPRQAMTGAPLALSVGPNGVGSTALISDPQSLSKVTGGVMDITGIGVSSIGEVTAPEFRYPLPVASVMSVGPSEFRSRDGEPVRFGLGPAGAWAQTAGSTTHLVATFHLPNGATVTGVTFFILDQVGTTDLTMVVQRLDYTAASTTVLGTVTSSGSDSAVRSYTIPLNKLVNNNGEVLMVRVSPTVSWPGSVLLSVLGARVDYTVPMVLP